MKTLEKISSEGPTPSDELEGTKGYYWWSGGRGVGKGKDDKKKKKRVKEKKKPSKPIRRRRPNVGIDLGG